MDKVALVKREVRMNEWARDVKACRESGMSILSGCSENGVSPKTYYYRLRKLREAACEQMPVKVSNTTELSSYITVRDADGISVEVSD